ncbi:MAG: helix-turn-helix transcriptional regulator [Patescibacteria group bacterium]|nr:MAG: helix-turn-helix transcriptional regulator [Patescibacteria group bacterium]
MSNNQTLGQRIRELRDEKDLSLRDFAVKLKLSPAFVSDVELGRRYPSEDVIAKMASVLGVKLKDLEAYDPKPVVEEIKRRTLQIDPELGILMRGNLKSDADYEELKKFLRTKDSKK